MPSNNPSGRNGLFVPEPAYGDVQTQERLVQQAPMSGAPIATAAQQAPRRAQRSATRPRQPRGQAQVQPDAPVMAQLPAPSYQQTFAQIAGQLAAAPGAGPNVRWLAQTAAAQAQSQGGAPFQGH